MTENLDFNSHHQIGYGKYAATKSDGLRNDTGAAFLRLVFYQDKYVPPIYATSNVACENHSSEPKPNLTIMDNSIVHKLIIEDKKCVGVKVGNSDRLRKSQKSVDILANGEVVLSAGAFISPALLQLRFIFEINEAFRYF